MTHALAQSHLAAAAGDTIFPCGPCEARTYGICSYVGHADLARLAALATIMDLSRGQTFIHEDLPAEHFWILILGSAKLFKLLPDGRRQIVRFAHAGNFLGLSASDRYGFSAEAIEPIRVCRISQRRLQAALSTFGAMEQRLFEVAVSELAQAHEQMLLLGRKTAIERVASFLLFQTSCPQPRRVRAPRIYLPMCRGDIADYLGLTVETIIRSLAKLEKLRIIVVPNVREIVVLDSCRLAALAHGSFGSILVGSDELGFATSRHLGKQSAFSSDYERVS